MAAGVGWHTFQFICNSSDSVVGVRMSALKASAESAFATSDLILPRRFLSPARGARGKCEACDIRFNSAASTYTHGTTTQTPCLCWRPS